MGQLREVICKNCGRSWQLQLGYGLRHGRPEAVAVLFPVEIQAELPIDKMRNFDEPWSFAMEPAVCSDCFAIVSVPVLRLPEKDKVYTGVCPDCGGSATPVAEDEISGTVCPVCGEKSLSVRAIGEWD